ncbi:hypothetical protein GWN42_19465 [candidate division KSB1 bacterium]|nr:hypothetical protein [candidate division KSB1 bacterium]
MKILMILSWLICYSFYGIGCSKHDSDVKQMDASKKVEASGQTPTQVDLPPNLLNVLREEMQQVESGMQLLLDYLARGEAQNAADIAMRIHDSFILKQSLSQAQMEKLLSLLPGDFIQLDRTFHKKALGLAESAQQGDFKSAIRIYGEMTQLCVSCHARHAQEKFPGLTTEGVSRD